MAVETVRKKYFQTGEMKSSKIGKKSDRRKHILGQLLPLPFTIFAIVFDKMLERLKKCRDLIKLGSTNELDVFDHSEYRTLKKYFDE